MCLNQNLLRASFLHGNRIGLKFQICLKKRITKSVNYKVIYQYLKFQAEIVVFYCPELFEPIHTFSACS